MSDTTIEKQIDNQIKTPPQSAWDVVIQKQLVRRDTQIAQAEAAAEAAAAAARAAEAARQAYANSVASRLKPQGTYSNNYAWGNCTWYVASRVAVPDSMGNANNWASALGSHATPLVGAIAQTTVGWAGHVAVVEAVQGDQVEVSEMNYEGLDVVDDRWTKVTDWVYLY